MTSAPLGLRLLRLLEGRLPVMPTRLRDQLAGLQAGPLSHRDVEPLAAEIVSFVTLFGGAGALDLFRELDAASDGAFALFPRDARLPVGREDAVLEVRERAAGLAARLGFRSVQRTKIVTAASELARNLHMYAHGGEVRLRALLAPRVGMSLLAVDLGPGIADVAEVLAGRVRSQRGMGLGLKGVKALADEFRIESSPAGTAVAATFFASRHPGR